MPKLDLSQKLVNARQAGKGLNLKPADVAELCEEIGSLAQVIGALQSQALAVNVPPQAVADTIADCLCLELCPSVTVNIYQGEWGVGSECLENGHCFGESLLDCLDKWRARLGKSAVSGQQILIDGNAVYQQIVASITK